MRPGRIAAAALLLLCCQCAWMNHDTADRLRAAYRSVKESVPASLGGGGCGLAYYFEQTNVVLRETRQATSSAACRLIFRFP